TRVKASDFGLSVEDLALAAFMREHQADGSRDSGKEFGFKRSVREITNALEGLTGQDAGREHIQVVRGDTPEARAQERDRCQAVADRFAAWWAEHGDGELHKRGLEPLELQPREGDPVEADGVSRYGRLFDLGPEAVLGPVRSFELVHPIAFDAPSHLDFERGHVYRREEGIESIDVPGGASRAQWWRASGADVGVLIMGFRPEDDAHGDTVWGARLRATHLRVVPVPNGHWDRLADELAAGRPLGDSPLRVDDELHYDRDGDGIALPAAFMFVTADRQPGIVQVLSQAEAPPRVTLRYRLIHADAAAAAAFEPGPPLADLPVEGFVWSEPRRVVLAGTDAAEPAALDLDSGRTLPIPEAMRHVNIRFDAGSTAKYERMMAWARGEGLDVVTMRSSDNDMAGVRGVTSDKLTIVRGRPSAMEGFSGVQAEPDAWDTLAADDAVQISRRAPRRPEILATNRPRRLYEHPPTLLFRTDRDRVGLLRYHTGWGEEPLIIEYKLTQPE
ncbi:MAG: hypothetical protein AAFX76_06920, partial [Planctomycetota bacterium]